jgi:hypothetical protein
MKRTVLMAFFLATCLTATAQADGTITGVTVDDDGVWLVNGNASVAVTIAGTGTCSEVRLRCEAGNPAEVPPVIRSKPFPLSATCTYSAVGTYTILARPVVGSTDCSGEGSVPVAVRVRLKFKPKEIVSALDVTPHGTFADFHVKTTEPATFELQASTSDEMSGGDLANVESATFRLGYTTDWSAPLGHLRAGTLFHYLLKVKPQSGWPYTKKGTFRTHKRRVVVSFEKVHMTDDSDDLSNCDCAFGFDAQGAPSIFYSGGVASGTNVHPGKSVTVDDAPPVMSLKAIGWDDDEDDWVPVGPFIALLLNKCAPLQMTGSSCDGDGAKGSTTIDTDFSGLTSEGEKGGGTFQISANGLSLKFQVSGSYAVSYLP